MSRTPLEVENIRKEMGTLADYDKNTQLDWFGRHTEYETPLPKDANTKFKIYRAVPPNAPNTITPGSYVTQSRKYANSHLESVLQGKGKIIEGDATLDELSAVNPNEFWYIPKEKTAELPAVTPLPSRAQEGEYGLTLEGKKLLSEIWDKEIGNRPATINDSMKLGKVKGREDFGTTLIHPYEELERTIQNFIVAKREVPTKEKVIQEIDRKISKLAVDAEELSKRGVEFNALTPEQQIRAKRLYQEETGDYDEGERGWLPWGYDPVTLKVLGDDPVSVEELEAGVLRARTKEPQAKPPIDWEQERIKARNKAELEAGVQHIGTQELPFGGQKNIYEAIEEAKAEEKKGEEVKPGGGKIGLPVETRISHPISEKQGLKVYQLDKPISVKSISGKVITLPKGETYYAYPKEGNKIILKDGKKVTIPVEELGKLAGMETEAITQPPAGGGMTEEARRYKQELKQAGEEKSKIETAVLGYKRGFSEARNEARAKIASAREKKLGLDEEKKAVIEYASKVKGLPYSQTALARAIRRSNSSKQVERIYNLVDKIADNNARKFYKERITKMFKRWSDSPSVRIKYRNYIKDWYQLYRDADRFAPTEELESIYKGMLEDVATGRAQFKSWKQEMDAKVENVKYELCVNGKPLETHPEIRILPGEEKQFVTKLQNAIRKRITHGQDFDVNISSTNVLMDLCDGGTGRYDGPHMRMMKGDFDNKFGVWLEERERIKKPVFDLMRKLKIGEPGRMKIGFYAAKVQKGGVEKLKALGFTDKEIESVKLNPAEMKLYTAMRNAFDELQPEISRVMTDVFNEPFKEVKNYFSFLTDWKAMDEAELSRWKQVISNEGDFQVRPTKKPEMGFTKERVGGSQKIKLDAWDIFNKHIDDATYLIHLAEPLQIYGKAVWSKDYYETMGPRTTKFMRDWIATMATKGGYSYGPSAPNLDWARANVGMATLGLKLSSAAVQPTAIFDAAAMIGHYAFKGLKNIALSKDWRKLVLSFPEIRFRTGDDPAYLELGWAPKVKAVSFKPLTELDKITAMGTAAGAYERKMNELGLPIDFDNVNEEAKRYAQFIVQETQSSAFFKDVPGTIERGGSINKWLWQFQNFLLKRWKLIQYNLPAAIREKEFNKAFNILFYLMCACVAETGIRRSVKKLLGKEPDQTFAKNLFWETANNIPIAGQVTSAILYGSLPVPVLEVGANIAEETHLIGKSKKPETKRKHGAYLAGEISKLLGVPGTSQLLQILKIQNSTREKGKEGGAGLPTFSPEFETPEFYVPELQTE